MKNNSSDSYIRGFIPYALAAFLIGIIGGFTAVLGPAFVQDIGIDYNNTTWTALSMAIASAAFAPVLGKLGDAIGLKNTLVIGLSVFTAGNILTALADSLIFMLIARFIVGMGTAAVAPSVMAYILTRFPQEKTAKGFSLYMLISSGAVIFGPTIGGLIIAASGWRAMMWLCTLICIIVLAACIAIRENNAAPRRPLKDFDIAGCIMILMFFGLFLCIPSFGQNFGWTSRPFIAVAAASAAALVLLVAAEKRAAQPVLSGSFMKRKNFFFSIAALFLTQGLMQANMTNIIVFVNYTQPENTIISSYAISIMYLGMSTGSVLLGPLADRYEPKNILTLSFLLTGAGAGTMLLFTANASVMLLALSLGLLGFGLGANGSIFMKTVLHKVPLSHAGAGTGTYGLFRDLAAPFGVAVFVPMFTNEITAMVSQGIPAASAAVNAVSDLAIAEIICVGLGIIAVRMLPLIHKKAPA